jgi:hypothetical protein
MLTLQKIEEYAKGIESGSLFYKRFPKRVVRGWIEGGTILVEASLVAGGSDSSIKEAGPRLRPEDVRISKQQKTKEYAILKGIWHEDTKEYLDDLYGEAFDKGAESLVYYNDGVVIKTSNTLYYWNVEYALDGIAIHNAYFPLSTIKVIGFGQRREVDWYGNESITFQIITEQPYIEEGNRVTYISEVENYMKKMGFRVKDPVRGNFENNYVIINDLRTANVILTPKNTLIPIDNIAKLNLVSIGGKWNPVNEISTKY